jgi:hypothetical protein
MQSGDGINAQECKQTYHVGWQQGKGLGACMLEMYDQSFWTDVTFRSKDHPEAVSIKAHKIVLAARSPVFQAMFFGPCADRSDDVDLEHVTRETFDLFLR